MKIFEITEQRTDEVIPLLAVGAGVAARWVLGTVIRKGGPPLLKWLAKKAFKWGFVGAGTIAAAEWTWDKVTELVGKEIVDWLIKNKIELSVVVVIIVAAVALKKYIENKMYNKQDATEMIEMIEAYTQKAGDYARPGKMPAKKRRGPHPLGGKLVG